MIDPETIALRTMRLGNTCLGIGDLGMTVRETLPGTMTSGGGGRMKPIQTSESGEMIAIGREVGARIDGSQAIRK
jgi:hypothetical protein